jgi:hypothetical protein
MLLVANVVAATNISRYCGSLEMKWIDLGNPRPRVKPTPYQPITWESLAETPLPTLINAPDTETLHRCRPATENPQNVRSAERISLAP